MQINGTGLLNFTPSKAVLILPTRKKTIMNLIQFFEYEHLPAHLQEISKPFGDLAKQMVSLLPMNPETTVMLRKLLESKDCAVRAKLFKNGPAT